jgi:hypothetical protein
MRTAGALKQRLAHPGGRRPTEPHGAAGQSLPHECACASTLGCSGGGWSAPGHHLQVEIFQGSPSRSTCSGTGSSQWTTFSLALEGSWHAWTFQAVDHCSATLKSLSRLVHVGLYGPPCERIVRLWGHACSSPFDCGIWCIFAPSKLSSNVPLTHCRDRCRTTNGSGGCPCRPTVPPLG